MRGFSMGQSQDFTDPIHLLWFKNEGVKKKNVYFK